MLLCVVSSIVEILHQPPNFSLLRGMCLQCLFGVSYANNALNVRDIISQGALGRANERSYNFHDFWCVCVSTKEEKNLILGKSHHSKSQVLSEF